jgi:hypothetical protein
MDERDTEALGFLHAREHDGLAVHRDGAPVGRLRAAQDLHERALSGAVLAHQRQHLSCTQGE